MSTNKCEVDCISVCSPVGLRNMKTPKGGQGREVEPQPQLQAYEGDEGELSHEGAVLGPVGRESCSQVAGQDQQDRPDQDVGRPPAALLEQHGAQHDRHHERRKYLAQWNIFLPETLIMILLVNTQ